METNTDTKEVANQIKSAFDFVQKLYNECSFLIKEIEGQLAINDNNFQILRPSGYSVSARSSTGLEPNNVNLWLLRKFAVAFVESAFTELDKGQNFTEINDELKVAYFRIILDDKNLNEPMLYFGVLYDIHKFKDWIKKFENLMGQFEYIDNKLFAKFPDIDYEDGAVKLKGKFQRVHLLDINSSEELTKKVINPTINMYRELCAPKP